MFSTIAVMTLAAGTYGAISPTQIRQIQHTDQTGTWVETQRIAFGAHGETIIEPAYSELWHYDAAIAIPESVAINQDLALAYEDLNDERLQAFDARGDGVPLYEVPLATDPHGSVSIADAADLGAVLSTEDNGSVTVRAYTSASDNELWTYTFPDDVNGLAGQSSGRHWVGLSDDGAVIIAAGTDTIARTSTVVVLDGATGAVLQSETYSERVLGVDISDDGSRAVLTVGDTAVVIQTSDMSELHRFSVSGQGSWHRISGNGKAAAAGGFNYAVWVENDSGVWQREVFGSASGNWFGAPAISGDASHAFIASHVYANSYLDTTYRVFDLATGDQLAFLEINGAGSLQDSIKVAQASDDGEVFAVCSWGTQDNAHPEVQVFDRELNRIGEIDTVGSPFFLDMTPDGSLVIAGAKSVHANTSGNGGDVIVIGTEAGCAADLDGDGDADADDFFLYLDAFATGDVGACDVDADDDCDADDFFGYLDLFAQAC